ncbi:MAG: valine--tRNA ligase [Oscillospiraceae bacterium]|nr:valine--tRNA ligase [Oscillospiraceae bacterium]
MKELNKVYDPTLVEDRIYQNWEEKGYFHASVDQKKQPYTIVMPPPNITGQLHMGHAVDNAMQDIIIRRKRMQGFAALWLPGTDHASIATEAKIVEAMAKEGLTKDDLGRDAFLVRAWDWKNQYGGRIVKQLRKLGSSCDWERERFTMDEGCSKAVHKVFKSLYDKGLIYRGNRMVNWCPYCNTSISDAEVEHEEQAGNFWHLLYPVKETGEMLELATTRPETMLGDTAVAINAEDPRYTHLHGCHVILPLLNKEIPIVCDEHADMTKGTGVVKITPAHDPNDCEVGLRHDLPRVRVFTYDGHMTGAEDKKIADELFASGRATVGEPEVLDCGKYAGMTTKEARKAILEDLEAGGYLKNVEPRDHEVGTCYRCHTTIEPMISKQWFVKMEPLAIPAMESVEKGEIRFSPERFTKIYMNWMRNTRDWCISRQLWWGHRIPAWYCDCGETIVAEEAPSVCPKCGSSHLLQDEDTLDTWFSSALWPFSTLGWPEKTPELDYFYPTNTLVTGYDIIGFWVSRMIFSGLAYTGKAPFTDVVIHGIVRDAQGRKMSKSLGNGIDPLVVIEQYGADALRYALIAGNSTGGDMRMSDEKLTYARNFCNKLWNAARFVLMNLGDEITTCDLPESLEPEDKWLLTHLNRTVKEVNENLEKFELGLAAEKMQEFIWDIFCDWYIELLKARLQAGGEVAKNAAQMLSFALNTTLRMLHPVMPFITEEIYQAVPHNCESIMIDAYPAYDPALHFPEEEEVFDKVIDVIRAVRNRRNEMNVPMSKKADLFIETKLPEAFRQGIPFLKRLAGAEEVFVGEGFDPEGKVSCVTDAAKVLLPLAQLVDREKELARLNGEIEKTMKEIASVEGRLANPGFVNKAPEQVLNATREKLEAAKQKLEKLQESVRAYQ